MTKYVDNFHSAVTRTQQLGLPIERDAPPSAPRFITQEIGERLETRLSEVLSTTKERLPESIALLCAQVNLKMVDHIEDIVGAAPMLTIGKVKTDGFGSAPNNNESLYSLAQTGNYHVWVTLPWFEIIDLTLMASLWKKKHLELGDVKIVSANYTQKELDAWEPLYIGRAATELMLCTRMYFSNAHVFDWASWKQTAVLL